MHQLKAYAGHTSITTTAKHYVGVSLEAMRAAINALKPLSEAVQPFGAKATTKATMNGKLGRKAERTSKKRPESGSNLGGP